MQSILSILRDEFSYFSATFSEAVIHEKILSLIGSYEKKQQLKIVYRYLSEIISEYKNQLTFPSAAEQKILVFLKLFPECCFMKDAKKLYFIHYACMMEIPNKQLILFLAKQYPQSLVKYGKIGFVEATPFHLILFKNDPDIDYEVALNMIEINPHVARMPTGGSKYPIHLSIIHERFLPRMTSVNRECYYTVLCKLLSDFPIAMFQEIIDEENNLELLDSELEIQNENIEGDFDNLDLLDTDAIQGNDYFPPQENESLMEYLSQFNFDPTSFVADYPVEHDNIDSNQVEPLNYTEYIATLQEQQVQVLPHSFPISYEEGDSKNDRSFSSSGLNQSGPSSSLPSVPSESAPNTSVPIFDSSFDVQQMAARTRVMIGDQQYRLVNIIDKWSPLSKALISSNPQIRSIFLKELNVFAKDYLKKEWKRK